MAAYSIVGLPPGKYIIRVIAPGFDLFEGNIASLPGGRASTFDAKVSVASEKQEVTVKDTQQVELDPAKNAGALVLKEADLDMLSDDPDDLQATFWPWPVRPRAERRTDFHRGFF